MANLDFHARQYDPQLGRFNNVDALANKFANISPYTGMGNNPILYIDPDGKKIIIAGKEVNSVVNQVNARYKNELSFTVEDGVLKASVLKKELSTEASFMLDAVNNELITVTLTTFSEEERMVNGETLSNLGEFQGNEVLEDENGTIKVITQQNIMPTLLERMDNYYESRPGTGVAHEILESYVGGLNSLRKNKSAGNSIIDYQSFWKAHNDNRVPKQSGDIIYRPFDENGIMLNDTDDPRVKVIKQQFEKKNKEPEVIFIFE